jgi:hypothetical protein
VGIDGGKKSEELELSNCKRRADGFSDVRYSCQSRRIGLLVLPIDMIVPLAWTAGHADGLIVWIPSQEALACGVRGDRRLRDLIWTYLDELGFGPASHGG